MLDVCLQNSSADESNQKAPLEEFSKQTKEVDIWMSI